MNFDQLIRRCNTFLFVHMYPAGKGYVLSERSIQHRDLVRTFFAGIFETLMLLDNREAAKSLVPEYERMTKADWLPDLRFNSNNVDEA